MSQNNPRRAGKIQMSEAIPTGMFLTLSGGFQDAYTYFSRGNVFANAQTGNIVLLGTHMANREWGLAMRYLAPVLAFVAGVYVAEHIRRVYKDRKDCFLHWRQIVVAIEIVVLFAVGFMPETMNMAANILVSFVCSMQVNAFRKIKGSPYASTMCIGNLRNATASFYAYRHSKDKKILDKCLRYYIVIIIFALGATLGSVLTERFGVKTIWFSCAMLLVSFLIMFVHEQIEEEGEL